MIGPGHFLLATLPDQRGYAVIGDSGVYALVPGSPLPPLLIRGKLGIGTVAMPRAGHTLFFEGYDPDGGEFIGAKDLPNGPVRRVIELPEHPIGLRSFDTDGTRFFFTMGQHQAEVWVADVTAQ